MWNYKTSIEWTANKQGTLQCAGKPDIEVATPPEFGGPEGFWTPEDLLTGSVESCIMASALFFLTRGKIGFHAYRSNAVSTMEKSPSGLIFNGIALEITLELQDSGQADAARSALMQAEKTCPLSGSLNCPVELEIKLL
ncbi:OsmC family protein [Pontiellaceae bacterium B1224]|nr:OsmC family protein [Pontiellaceae bacterium B1224]